MTLRSVRINSGLKAKKIADDLGISRVQLYNLEKGINKITDDKIVKLSEIYNIPKSKILSIIKEESFNE
ncbi:MAG: helix-turn-helix transcriptional regulator [Clostridium perfringens]|nr:helix-turn-helix transcriptional regulator [Clostridium perfringens]MDU1308498.1 helix-turn-helix transcriptional regulator [Clostridium perfringens]